jgi:hypothetical protein
MRETSWVDSLRPPGRISDAGINKVNYDFADVTDSASASSTPRTAADNFLWSACGEHLTPRPQTSALVGALLDIVGPQGELQLHGFVKRFHGLLRVAEGIRLRNGSLTKRLWARRVG